MRINLFIKMPLCLLLAVASHDCFAAGGKKSKQGSRPVPNFMAGTYVLVDSSKGAEESCSEGEFKVVENGQNILLGPKHGFLLANKMEKNVATDDPEEKGCVYENTNSYTVNNETTIVSMREVLRCDATVRHTFVETALITKDRVHLEFKQTAVNSPNPSDAAAEYKCDWTLSSRSAASLFMKKKAIEKRDKEKIK
jgi:hypothetical protein